MPLQVENGIPIIPLSIPVSPEGFHADLDLTASLAAAAASELEIPLSKQEKPLWCWVACAKMVLYSFGQKNISQCQIAKSLLGKNCCGASTSSSYCNQDCSADDVGTVFHLWNVYSVRYEDTVSFSKIQAEISEHQRPIEVGIKWGGNNGGHLVVIRGWSLDQHVRYVKVNDPYYGLGEVRFSDLSTYRGGRWIYTWAEFKG